MPTARASILSPFPEPPPPGEAWGHLWLPDAWISWEGGVIAGLGPFDGRPVDEDLRPGILLPGHVDVHVHAPQMRIVGSASGPLLPWLERSTFPEESRFSDESHADRVYRAFVTALASAGTTTALVYGTVHAAGAHALFRALDRGGLRAIAGPVWMDEGGPPALMTEAAASRALILELLEAWGGHPRLEVAVIPRFALSCSPASLRLAGELAQDRGLWVSTHLSENRGEIQEVARRFPGRDYLSVYEDAGLVGRRTVLAHCIHLEPRDWERLGAADAVVAHCPDSNNFLGSGGMNLPEVLRREVRFGLGTDIAAGRSFRLGHAASAAYDNALRHGLMPKPTDLLAWGTRVGALALGQARGGALAAGFQADFQCIDVPEWAEGPDEILGWSLLFADAPPPRKTWVGGEVVWDRAVWNAGGGAFPWEGPHR